MLYQRAKLFFYPLTKNKFGITSATLDNFYVIKNSYEKTLAGQTLALHCHL